MSDEQKLKISKTVKETYTDEHRQAVSKAHKGKPLTCEHKQKISDSCRAYWANVKQLLNEKEVTK
jgi:hypothetical protein